MYFESFGAFIKVAQGATLYDIEFIDVRLGTRDEPLRAHTVTASDGSPRLCLPQIGGIVGLLARDKTSSARRATLSGVKVRGLNAFVDELFGGVVYLAFEADLTDTHLLPYPDGSASTITFRHGRVAGMVYQARDADLTRSSVEVHLIQRGVPQTPQFTNQNPRLASHRPVLLGL